MKLFPFIYKNKFMMNHIRNQTKNINDTAWNFYLANKGQQY